MTTGPSTVVPCVLTDRMVVDIETGSGLDLKNVTADVYAQHPSTVVYCVVFGLLRENDDAVAIWRWIPCAAPRPPFLDDFVGSGGTMVAWNVGFERAIWRHHLCRLFDWPAIPDAQWVDAQAYSAALSLPVALGKAAHALAGVDTEKDAEGAKLMKKLALFAPGPDGKWILPAELNDETHARLVDYCEQDVLTTAAVLRRLLRPSIREHHVWLEDQAINQRGLCLDVERAGKMARLALAREAELEAHVEDVTVTALASVKGVPKLKAWLSRRGVVDADASLSADVVKELLATETIPDDVQAVLETRLEVGKLTSLAKLKRLDDVLSPDGRARGLLRYYGAHTGRWSSGHLQVHNLRKDRRSATLRALCDAAIDAEDLTLLGLLDSPLDALSAALRSLVVAPPGHDLIAADYSAIEARVLAWLAGDTPKLDFIRTFDAAKARGETPEDLYQRTARSIGSRDRQLGKVAELALGYGMGPLKFAVQAKKLGGVVLEKLEARRVQRAWREVNVRTVQLWAELENAFRHVVRNPGTKVTVGRMTVASTAHASVTIQLPGGRKLWYHKAREAKRDRKVPVLRDDGTVEMVTFDIPALVYETPGGAGMMLTDTYGGKLAENVTQGVARDVLAEGLLTLRDTCYAVVLHVHDSVVAEVPEGTGDVQAFEHLICKMPTWANGLPITADGYRAKRFHG